VARILNTIVVIVIVGAGYLLLRSPSPGNGDIRSYFQLQSAARHGLAGDFESTIDLATETLDRQPSNCVALTIRGIAYRQQGEYERAIADLDRAIELNPRFADAYVQRAFAYQQMDLADTSQQIFADTNRAIVLDRTNPLAYTVRGYEYTRAGDYARAVADFDEALRLDSSSYSAMGNRAFANLMLDRLPEARRDVRTALSMNPKPGDRQQLQMLQQRIDATERETRGQAAIQAHR